MYSFTNKLINETSPYLLQHAHNPVNWYPWGNEALEKAIEEDKPILVSIGYSACHWCHVMERESFEDETTANLMNELFINIKIDREERPDLDHIYMDAVQAIAGNGGWPLNVFLTPSKKPFYGGTYFPPVRAFNRSSWKEVLTGVSTLFKDKRNEVEAQAEELVHHVGKPFTGIAGDSTTSSGLPGSLKLRADTVFENIMKQADTEWGGFGNAPKFPQSFTINYLLRYNHYTGNTAALTQALLSLDKMIEGGIYDQLGGGFARYSTDAEWLAPHFEKMLYDNALLLVSLADAYSITQKESYRTAIEGTIEFLKRELMNEGGAFYAALDADSEGVEGKFYVWSYDEVQQILKDEAALFCAFYDITPSGNWEHANILRILKPLPAFAQEQQVNEEELRVRLNACRELLLRERAKRIRPALDNKILVSWNALMVVGLCKASAALENEDYKALAIRCFDYIWDHCRIKESFELRHSLSVKSNGYAFVDDYSGMIKACIHLQEITSDTRFLSYTKGLLEFTEAHFLSGNGYFLYTGDQQNDIVVRKTEIYDGATPSGNSELANSLYYLGIIFEKSQWKDQSYALISGISGMLEKYPGSFGNWGCFLIDLAYEINELAIVGEGYIEFRDNILKNFIPNKIIQAGDGAEMADFALLNQKPASGKALLYLCRNYTCTAPVDNLKDALQQLVKKI